MRRLFAAGLVIAVVLSVRYLQPGGAEEPPTAALALGFTLVAAVLIGDVLRRFQMPRLTGYLLFGILVGPYVGNVISEAMARQLQPVNGIATVLIALIAGLTLNIERVRRRVHGIAWVVGALGAAAAGLFLLIWLAWPWLPISPSTGGLVGLVMAALFTVTAITFSPTMTAAVISETGARGRVSDLVLAIVVIVDLLALVAFAVLVQVGRVVLQDTGDDVNVLARLAWEIGGAIAFGGLIGSLLALYLRYVGRELTLVLLGVCALLSQVGAAQRIEPLLAAMTAGLVIQNASTPQGDALKTALQHVALPVLIVFFVSTGASLQLDVLRSVGLVAMALAGARLLLIRLSLVAGLRVAGLDRAMGGPVWAGLISQAGITLGFASVLATEFPGWGSQMQTLLIATIALNELIGPALFRLSLARIGEIDTVARLPLLVVSNREPYAHNYDAQGEITVSPTTGGVAVALDALMRERNGVWIAYGDGTADRAVVGDGDKVRVPVDRPAYLLRRLWLDRREYSAYYGGFANEGLWPLCHLVDVRPKFRSEEWAAYQRVNAQFAAAIDQELPTPETPVFIQDYHLALAAASLRERRPGARTALFWHIPWPYPDRLRICPWRRELLEGLLANDLLAFQLERDLRNFLLAASEELGAEVEDDGARVRLGSRVTSVVAVPIGVDYDRIQAVSRAATFDAERERLFARIDLRADIIGVGVDRLDYTKGIPERLDALDRVFTDRPALRGRLTFVQVGVPSRSELGSYSAIAAEISAKVAKINARHGQPGLPPPIAYYNAALDLPALVALYRLAHFCIVSSLHDGMNLVAKEFVAARDDEDGILVLSALAGAAQELRQALIINPYDVDDFAQAIARALDMPRAERQARMREMRRIVAGRNVFSWASDILEGLESLWTRPLQYAVRTPEDAPV